MLTNRPAKPPAKTMPPIVNKKETHQLQNTVYRKQSERETIEPLSILALAGAAMTLSEFKLLLPSRFFVDDFNVVCYVVYPGQVMVETWLEIDKNGNVKRGQKIIDHLNKTQTKEQ